ncbi:hypothetical protein HYV85_02920 [Candidatus Woesearchaeota archaeon]|nr:hypothetical protein [Candidatus Woesearchaeota archaeon]
MKVNLGQKSGQAAMEFLMTYGWAILVVLVVIGALAYFGVLSPSTLLPEKCTFPVSLSCTDHSVGGTSITLILQNGAGRDMTVTRVSAASEALGTGNLGIGCSTGTITTTIRNGASATFTLNTLDSGGAPPNCAFRDTGRDKNRYNVTLSYNWLDSPTITHQLSGEMLARRTS